MIWLALFVIYIGAATTTIWCGYWMIERAYRRRRGTERLVRDLRSDEVTLEKDVQSTKHPPL